MDNRPIVASGALARRVPALRSPRREAWAAVHDPIVRSLVVLAGALVFLSTTATVQVVYTIRPSYVLLALATILGIPYVLRGWRRMPLPVILFAAALLVAYFLAAALGDGDSLVGQRRASSTRALVYLADLGFGLSVIGLIAGIWSRLENARSLAIALVVGLGLASLYALYQWPARHFGWPFSDVNNALDSSGVTRGAFQGSGFFGWERVRGTFIEPQILASYLAALLPLGIALARRPTPAGLLAGASALVAVAALPLTSSAPPLALLVAAAFAAVAIAAAARARFLVAGAAATTLIATLVLAPIVLSLPELIAPITGRSAQEVAITTEYRTDRWEQSITIWTAEPAFGHGPGQSAVQHTIDSDLPPDARPREAGPLESAQGLWAASLVDAGVLGFSFWILLFGAILLTGVRAAIRMPTALNIGTVCAAGIGIAASQISGDRLELHVWVLLGLALLMASGENPERESPKTAQRAESRTE
jgi:hypothetical protein